MVTRAEFEQLVDAVAPTMAPPARKQLATQYGMALVMVHKAHQMGSGPGTQVSGAHEGGPHRGTHQGTEPEPAGASGHVSDKEIEDYYHNNEAAFQEVDLQRIFIPRSKQTRGETPKTNRPTTRKDAPRKSSRNRKKP